MGVDIQQPCDYGPLRRGAAEGGEAAVGYVGGTALQFPVRGAPGGGLLEAQGPDRLGGAMMRMEIAMTGRIPAKVASLAAALTAAAGVLAMMAGGASAAVVYNNLPTTNVKDLPSLGFEATSTAQFGGEVAFAGSARANPTVIVDMSSWACQSGGGASCKTTGGATFSVPITLSIYDAGPEGSVGAPVGSITETFAIPYRPSAKKSCPLNTAEDVQGWGSECDYGKLHKVKFKLSGVALPSEAIVAVSYNTETYGSAPTGAAGPYDSLNVAVNASYTYNEATEEYEANPVAPSVGSDPLPEDVFINSQWSAMYCGNEAATGSFGDSGPCWHYEQPAIEVKASAH
jgi:hypothetical protein